MLRLTSLSNKYARRTLRALHAQTQGYPYPARLLSSFSRTGGQIAGTATTGVTGSVSAIMPGAVAEKRVGDIVTLANANAASSREFGLFANFVGGPLSDIPPEEDAVGVWRGAGSVWELLAPAFDATNLSTAAAAEAGSAATEVYLNSDATGRLAGNAGAQTVSSTARLLAYYSANAIEIELLV